MVLAAGTGSRLGYLGGILPKTMVPVRGRPLLYHALTTLSELGASEARVALGPGSELASRYLRTTSARSFGLRSVRTVELRRPTRSPVETLVRALPRSLPGTVAVALGDDLTAARGLDRWEPEFRRRRAAVAQAVVPERDRQAVHRTCEVEVDARGWIVRIREKPRTLRGGQRGCGLYLFRGETFPELLARAGGVRDARSLTDLVGAGVRVGGALAMPLEGSNINVNTVGDLLQAWTLVPRDREVPL